MCVFKFKKVHLLVSELYRTLEFDLIQVEPITCRTAIPCIANRQQRRLGLKMKRLMFVSHTVRILMGLNELEPL